MIVIDSYSPDQGFADTLRELRSVGVISDSRNGPVLRFPIPVTVLHHYTHRFIVTWPKRGVNPFFSIFETLWMLAGRDDLSPLLPYNSTFGQYSDDGSTIRGSAYGKRWRDWFGLDQLERVILNLKSNPEDRRIVLQMWDACTDFSIDSKDVPCNTNIFFSVTQVQGSSRPVLDMTVCNRSNDIIYGMFGSNLVHFSILQRYVAEAIGVEPGNYYQMSINAHLYLDNPVSKLCLKELDDLSLYAEKIQSPSYAGSLLATPNQFSLAVDDVFRDTDDSWPDWLAKSILPAMQAYRIYKLNPGGKKPDLTLRKSLAREILAGIPDDYFRWVFENWLETRS